jgi:hypothetical protein
MNMDRGECDNQEQAYVFVSTSRREYSVEKKFYVDNQKSLRICFNIEERMFFGEEN